jgi:hypothetical protein
MLGIRLRVSHNTYDVATRVGTSHVSTTRVGILMTSDLRLIETACIHCLYRPVFDTELGKSSSVAFNSQTTLPKLVFTDCWDLANPNKLDDVGTYSVSASNSLIVLQTMALSLDNNDESYSVDSRRPVEGVKGGWK